MYVLVSSGRLDEARQLAIDLLHNGGDDRPGADELRMRLAQVMVLQGDVAGARENLEGCRALLGERRPPNAYGLGSRRRVGLDGER